MGLTVPLRHRSHRHRDSVFGHVAGHCSSTGWQYVGTEKGEGFTGGLSDVRYPMILPMISKNYTKLMGKGQSIYYNTYIYIYVIYVICIYHAAILELFHPNLRCFEKVWTILPSNRGSEGPH